MTKTTQTVRLAAHAVSVAGLTFAAPALADEEMPGVSFDVRHSNVASPTMTNAFKSEAGRLTSEIRSDVDDGSNRETADQSRSYATELKNAYTRMNLGENPALAALATNMALLATRAPTR